MSEARAFIWSSSTSTISRLPERESSPRLASGRRGQPQHPPLEDHGLGGHPFSTEGA